MCLQDVKLHKAYEPKGSVVEAQATSAATIGVTGAGARRYIRFALNDDPLNLAGRIGIFWVQGSVPICLGWISSSDQFLELFFTRHGVAVYGPFSVFGPGDAGFDIGVFELLANTDEELAV
jgi:hypothetical protein